MVWNASQISNCKKEIWGHADEEESYHEMLRILSMTGTTNELARTDTTEERHSLCSRPCAADIGEELNISNEHQPTIDKRQAHHNDPELHVSRMDQKDASSVIAAKALLLLSADRSSV